MDRPGSVVSLEGVTKRFTNHTAVSDLDFVLPGGGVCGLLGPNGSGKTTTIRMIMGILQPDLGNVSLFGGNPEKTRQRVGYLPEERGIYQKMKVLDFVAFIAELRGIRRQDGRRRAGEWLERFGLSKWADKKADALSKGMQQKVQFISTVIHDPDLLILDEPFSGLDPINQDFLERIVREFKDRGTTILFSTHLMHQAEQLCDRVCLISRSRKIIDSDLRSLKASERGGAVGVEFEGDDRWIRGPEIDAVEEMGGWLRLILRDGVDHQPILERAVKSGARILRFELIEPSLHEIFVRYAGDEPPADEEIGRA